MSKKTPQFSQKVSGVNGLRKQSENVSGFDIMYQESRRPGLA